MSTYLIPALSRIASLDIRNRTHFNAVKTALNLYIIRAKTGQLPDELPADMPKDMFSGEEFEYEKTNDGFVLRCQGKDLSKDEIYQYEFKVKKLFLNITSEKSRARNLGFFSALFVKNYTKNRLK